MYGGMLDYYPDIIENTFAALALCVNLRSLTWIEEDTSAPEILPALLDTVRTLPLCALTIRTHSDFGADVWAQIMALEGIKRIVLWCMDGPPRALHGKIARLGTTLTHLELGVSAFAYPPSERACLPFPSLFQRVHVTDVDSASPVCVRYSMLQFLRSFPCYSSFVSRARMLIRSLQFSRASQTSIRSTLSILPAPRLFRDIANHPAPQPLSRQK